MKKIVFCCKLQDVYYKKGRFGNVSKVILFCVTFLNYCNYQYFYIIVLFSEQIIFDQFSRLFEVKHTEQSYINELTVNFPMSTPDQNFVINTIWNIEG